MQNDLATVRGVVNSLLRQHVDEAARQAGVIDDGLVDFWQRIGTVMQAGGKRLRPYLLVLAYEACGGNDRWTVMPVAVAWEALHQALLIHDDIIDNDNWRHGQPNVAGMYDTSSVPASPSWQQPSQQRYWPEIYCLRRLPNSCWQAKCRWS